MHSLCKSATTEAVLGL